MAVVSGGYVGIASTICADPQAQGVTSLGKKSEVCIGRLDTLATEHREDTIADYPKEFFN